MVGQGIAGEDGEGLSVGLHCLGQAPRPRRAPLPLAQNPKGISQVVLGHGPVQGQDIAGVDGEGLPVGLHRLGQMPRPFHALLPFAQNRFCGAESITSMLITRPPQGPTACSKTSAAGVEVCRAVSKPRTAR